MIDTYKQYREEISQLEEDGDDAVGEALAFMKNEYGEQDAFDDKVAIEQKIHALIDNIKKMEHALKEVEKKRDAITYAKEKQCVWELKKLLLPAYEEALDDASDEGLMKSGGRLSATEFFNSYYKVSPPNVRDATEFEEWLRAFILDVLHPVKISEEAVSSTFVEDSEIKMSSTMLEEHAVFDLGHKGDEATPKLLEKALNEHSGGMWNRLDPNTRAKMWNIYCKGKIRNGEQYTEAYAKLTAPATIDDPYTPRVLGVSEHAPFNETHFALDAIKSQRCTSCKTCPVDTRASCDLGKWIEWDKEFRNPPKAAQKEWNKSEAELYMEELFGPPVPIDSFDGIACRSCKNCNHPQREHYVFYRGESK